MSWHYSQALEEAYSAANSSDGEPFALLKKIPMHGTYWSPGKTTDAFLHSRSGMTYAPLTESHGEAVLMWCLADSLAKTSPQPEREQVSKESKADCGMKWHESSVRFDPISCSWKTVHSLFDEDLPLCSVILPRWGMMRNGAVSELPMSVLHTTGKGSGLWLPTPTAHNAKEGNYPAEKTRNTPTLASVLGGKINPEYSEWLMGWPIKWTDLKQSATDKFQQWQHSHGIS